MITAPKSNNRAGAVLPLMVALLVAVIGIAALSINSNWLMYHRINAQNTADLTARSAMARVQSDVREDKVDHAKELGRRIYNLNYDRDGVEISTDQIQLGSLTNFDSNMPDFVKDESHDSSFSAVHVLEPTIESHGSVPVFLSNFVGGTKNVKVVASATSSTKPVDIMLCLDASRSMNRVSTSDKGLPPGAKGIHEPPRKGSRWFEVKDTIELFLASLVTENPNARIGLVTFGGGIKQSKHITSDLDLDWARTEVNLVAATHGDITINETLESYVTDFPALGLGTSIYDGLDSSLAAFDNHEASRHVILLSDGKQVAQGRPAETNAAYDAADAGVRVHTISFGSNIKSLPEISDITSGTNFTALNEEQLQAAFRQLLSAFRVQLAD